MGNIKAALDVHKQDLNLNNVGIKLFYIYKSFGEAKGLKKGICGRNYLEE
jgi:hypothetical protein